MTYMSIREEIIFIHCEDEFNYFTNIMWI